MLETSESAILAELERAELAARERRLEAQATADRIHDDARLSAERIRAGADARITTELEAFRRRTLDEAAREVAEIEARIAALDREAGPVGEAPSMADHGSGFERAVEAVVAAVLGETGPEA